MKIHNGLWKIKLQAKLRHNICRCFLGSHKVIIYSSRSLPLNIFWCFNFRLWISSCFSIWTRSASRPETVSNLGQSRSRTQNSKSTFSGLTRRVNSFWYFSYSVFNCVYSFYKLGFSGNGLQIKLFKTITEWSTRSCFVLIWQVSLKLILFNFRLPTWRSWWQRKDSRC